jgi:hypothetical protein
MCREQLGDSELCEALGAMLDALERDRAAVREP